MSNYNELKLTYQGGRQETITLTSNTIEFGEYQRRDIVSVEVPEIIQTIGVYAFCDNNSLANIVLNEGLKIIEGQAFQHGVYTAVTIPSTVTEIGYNSFNTIDEQRLDHHTFTVTCLASTPPMLDDPEGITFGSPDLLTIYVPATSVEDYKREWPDYADKIQAIPTPQPSSGFSTLDITAAYVGDTEVEKIYLGTDIVWGGGEPGPDYSKMPLTFNIISAGTIFWKAQNTGYTTTIEYSMDNGETWTSITSNTGDSAPSISVNAGDVVQFRGDNEYYSSNTLKYNCFCGSTATFEAEGNIMSLIDSTNFAIATTLVSSYTFYFLFSNCTGLTSAEKMKLPATTLAERCYANMFHGCTSLSKAPELPATTLASYCYNDMFHGCTSLTTAPELPATSLATYCYSNMFNSCGSLTIAPELPATTLASYCYINMFSGCTSLTTAPTTLPATRLETSSYQGMFRGCTSLTTAPATLPATTLANASYQRMFQGCTSLRTAPEILATDYATNVCQNMFQNCSNLNYIKCMFSTAPSGMTSFNNPVYNWVSGVGGHGTFVKNPAVSDWPTGNSGIPTGWTVVDATE